MHSLRRLIKKDEMITGLRAQRAYECRGIPSALDISRYQDQSLDSRLRRGQGWKTDQAGTTGEEVV